MLASGPGYLQYLFAYPGGQAWPGLIGAMECILLGAFVSVLLMRPLRRRVHHWSPKQHVTSELDRLREWLAELFDGDAALEQHTEALRRHVSDELADLRAALAAIVEPTDAELAARLLSAGGGRPADEADPGKR
jgi:hypothetical protein